MLSGSLPSARQSQLSKASRIHSAFGVTTLRIVGLINIKGAPTDASLATALRNPVNGTTVNLSVVGADDGGESLLKYTWSAVGTPPAPITFSDNSTNAAKHAIATFGAS